MRTYASSRVKRKSFYRKSELQMFLLISGGQTVHQYGVSIQSSQTVGHKDLRFGQRFYILVFYNISFPWLLPLDGFQFIILCRVYCVAVKTKNSRRWGNDKHPLEWKFQRGGGPKHKCPPLRKGEG